MGLVRSWLSGTARAMGVSLAVPLVLIAVLLAVTIGGVKDLGSLRQVVAGPAIPDTATATSSARRSAPPGSRLPPIPSGPPVVAATSVDAPDAGRTRPGTRRRLARRVPGAERRTPGAQPGAPAGTPPSGSPPRERPLRPVRTVGERLRRVVEPLPPPVGPTASDAIETVLDIVDPPKKKLTGAQKPGSAQPAAGAPTR
jgi:hypothetical protein